MDYPNSLRAAMWPSEARPKGQAACREISEMLHRIAPALRLTAAAGGVDHRDRTLGIATVIQTAAELSASSVTLLEAEQAYSAAALLRQLVEVEYLAWALGEDLDEAIRWVRTTDHREREKFFRPQKMRDRSNGAFRDEEYWAHCNRGGHPNPSGVLLLENETPGMELTTPVEERLGLLWDDLTLHLVNIWGYLNVAVKQHNFGYLLTEHRAQRVTDSISEWQKALDAGRRAGSADDENLNG